MTATSMLTRGRARYTAERYRDTAEYGNNRFKIRRMNPMEDLRRLAQPIGQRPPSWLNTDHTTRILMTHNILLVTTTPLQPANSGGRVYTWGTTAPLARDFNYHLVAMANKAEQAEFDADRNELDRRYREVFRTYEFMERPPIPSELKRNEVLKHLGRHTRFGLPLMDVSYYSEAAVDSVRRVVREQHIDLIEVDHLQMAFVRRFVPEIPAVLINHNIEGDLHPFWMTDRWSGPELAVWRSFAEVSRRNSRRIELRNSLGFAAKLFISAVDAARVDDSCPKYLLPVPMHISARTEPFHSDRFEILWLGGFGWPPNIQGATWFMQQVWPRFLDLTDVEVKLRLVGGSPPEELRAYADDPRVDVPGHVPDISSVKERSDVLIAPLLTGSGVRVKTVEAMAAGLPVVATTKGYEGLDAVPGRDLLVSDDPEGFARHLAHLADSLALRERLNRAAVGYVESHHDPERVAQIKAEAFRALLSR